MRRESRVKNLLVVTLLLSLIACGKNDDTNFESMSLETNSFSSGIIIGGPNAKPTWKSVTPSTSSKVKQNAQAVADIRIPTVGSRCTGFLISNSVLMTNHHCITKKSDAIGVTANFDRYQGIPKENQRKYKCDKFIMNDKELDFALLKCSGFPGKKYGYVTLSTARPVVHSGIYIIQQNCDYYKIRRCDPVKIYSRGKVKDYGAGRIAHNADTLGGSSGSPIFSAKTNRVIAIHNAGRGNGDRDGRGTMNFGVPMNEIVNMIKRSASGSLNPGDQNLQENPIASNTTKSSALNLATFDSPKTFTKNSGESNYFYFELDKLTAVGIAIKFIHAAGDLDLRLYDRNMNLIATSATSENKETIVKKLKAGPYLVEVVGYRGAGNTYIIATKNIK